MAICIKCGSYNKKYKYMIFYILIMLPLHYFFGDLFPDEMKLKYLRSEYYPKEIFIIDIFNFLGIYLQKKKNQIRMKIIIKTKKMTL